MWFLFHANAKSRAVPNGERFVETCPECHVRGTFIEVEVEENVGVFFIDLLGDKKRAFRCTSCTGTFDWKDEPADVARPKTATELARERKRVEYEALVAEKLALAAASEREVVRADRAERVAIKIEDELAELKARLGKR